MFRLFAFRLFANRIWPVTSLDWVALATFIFLGAVLPLVGWLFLSRDLRRWYLSLGRALVVVARYLPSIPAWARRDTPRCLAAFGLRLPCSATELKRAYRRKVKQMHPDHGGDRRQFLWLQSQFEEALELVQPGSPHASHSVET